MAGLALTILLGLLWLAFAALGYWHGGWRQVVLLAGMLLSYAVVSEWAAPNGHDLATQFHWSLPRATTVVGLLYLLGGTLVLGLLGSFALERPYPLTVRERQCGAAMGVLNGGLLLALVLRTLRSYAYVSGGGDALRTSALSRFLIESIGYVLLAALVLGLIAVVMGLSLVRRRESAMMSAPDFIAAETEEVAPASQRAPYPPVERAHTAPPPAPVAAALARAEAAPVYAAEPIIDWPSALPPGTPVKPGGSAGPVAARPAPEKPPVVTEPERQIPIPAMPMVPRRVEPPMRYPIAELIATSAVPVRSAPQTASDTASPAAPVLVAASTPLPVARPTTPPPGALHPAFVSPTVARPPLPPPLPSDPRLMQEPPPEPAPTPETAPPIVRQVDVATDDALPVVAAADVATPDTPPVVREIDVTTQDVPLVAKTDAALVPTPVEPVATTGGERMNAVSPAPATPEAVTETTPIPAIGPPPSPPLPARRAPSPAEVQTRPAPQDEPAKARGGFARVAVARQAGQHPDPSPALQPPAPEPLQPPLPTGPRVHACPACGYPVRDHARFCPNCGTRQRR